MRAENGNLKTPEREVAESGNGKRSRRRMGVHRNRQQEKKPRIQINLFLTVVVCRTSL